MLRKFQGRIIVDDENKRRVTMHIADHYTSSYEILLGEFWRTKGGLLDVMIFVFVLAQTTRTVVQVITKKTRRGELLCSM